MSKHLSIFSSKRVADHARRRPNERRRAKSAVIWGFALLMLSVIPAALLVDRMPTEVRFPEAGWVLRRAATHMDAMDVVFLGSSRFDAALMEDRIQHKLDAQMGAIAPRVFNSSVPAGDPMSQLYMLDRLNAMGIHPKMLVMEVTPETLAYRNSWMKIHIMRELSLCDELEMIVQFWEAGTMDRLTSSRLFPWYRHNKHWREWALRVVDHHLAGGCLFAESDDVKPWINLTPVRLGTEVAPGMPRWMSKWRLGGRNVEALQEIIRRCKRDSVKLVLVGMPVSAIHRSTYTPSILEKYREFVAQTGLPFYPLQDLIPDDLFHDHHHMEPEGAEIFSDKMVELILDMGAEKNDGTSAKKTPGPAWGESW